MLGTLLQSLVLHLCVSLSQCDVWRGPVSVHSEYQPNGGVTHWTRGPTLAHLFTVSMATGHHRRPLQSIDAHRRGSSLHTGRPPLRALFAHPPATSHLSSDVTVRRRGAGFRERSSRYPGNVSTLTALAAELWRSADPAAPTWCASSGDPVSLAAAGTLVACWDDE